MNTSEYSIRMDDYLNRVQDTRVMRTRTYSQTFWLRASILLGGIAVVIGLLIYGIITGISYSKNIFLRQASKYANSKDFYISFF